VVQRLIRRIEKTDQAFRLGDGPAVQTSLNSSGWSRRRSDPAIKRSPSAWLRRSLTCCRCDVSSADLIIRNSFGGGGQPREVSQIERGEVATVEALATYITALGGKLELVADIG
jgi:hypothetical protein